MWRQRKSSLSGAFLLADHDQVNLASEEGYSVLTLAICEEALVLLCDDVDVIFPVQRA